MYRCYGGIDDGYFERDQEETVLSLAIHCVSKRDYCPTRIYTTTIKVDGTDSTRKVVELLEKTKNDNILLSAVLLDTNIFAGFNILDPEYVYSYTKIPLIIAYWYPIDEKAIESALCKHFSDWHNRLQILKRTWKKLRRVSCKKGSLYIAPYGISYGEAWSIVCSLQVFSRQPEPLYTAHVFSSAFSRYIYGK